MERHVSPPEKYICQSTVCRSEIEILPRHRAGEISNPRCTCGSGMKKAYEMPRFYVYGNIMALTQGNGKLAVSLDGLSHVLKT
jgi:hypothetical protein